MSMLNCKDCRYYNRSWMKLEPCNQCFVPDNDDRDGAYGNWFLRIDLTDRDVRYRKALSLLVDDAMFLEKIEEYVRACDEPTPTGGGFPYEIKWSGRRFFASIPALEWKGCRAEGETAQEAVDQLGLEYEGFDSYEGEYERRVDVGWVPSETIDGYEFMVERTPEEDGGGFTAYVPALGGKACCADGYTVLGAIKALHKSITTVVSVSCDRRRSRSGEASDQDRSSV